RDLASACPPIGHVGRLYGRPWRTGTQAPSGDAEVLGPGDGGARPAHRHGPSRGGARLGRSLLRHSMGVTAQAGLPLHDGAHHEPAGGGRHACFDRLVIDLGPREPGWPGPDANGYQVRYVGQFTSDPSDRPIALAGGADLSIVVHARTTDGNGRATYRPADATHAINVAGFSTFRQVLFGGA